MIEAVPKAFVGRIVVEMSYETDMVHARCPDTGYEWVIAHRDLIDYSSFIAGIPLMEQVKALIAHSSILKVRKYKK